LGELNARILMVDDEPEVIEGIVQQLSEKFSVNVASSVHEAKRIIAKEIPHLILLDINMGKDSGVDFCNEVRTSSKTQHIPILMLSGTTDLDHKRLSFISGADGFIEKPAHAEEVEARVLSKLRRWQEFLDLDLTGKETKLTCGNATLHPSKFLVSFEGIESQLSRTEFELLMMFAKNPDRVLSRETIMDRVWGGTKVGERTIDAHLTNLKKKVGEWSHEIISVYGAGFMLREKLMVNVGFDSE
jgi:DNA-binding response OmpR family regulator